MIIVRLIGGLGNQLFQYALGRELAFRHDVKLLLDTSAFRTYKRHPNSLFNFNIKEPPASQWQLLKTRLFSKITAVHEKEQSFNPHVFDLPPNIYLTGYWQSEKYFKETSSAIRQDITLKKTPNEKYFSMLAKINGSNSISLHIRRTNYLTIGLGIFEVITTDYYRGAVVKIAERIDPPEIYVFSDDIGWAKRNLSFPFPTTFVSANNFPDYQELMLMAACKHNITANSTFSWWGAWLNNNPKKIVVTPKRWFTDASRSDADLIPSAWIRL